FHLRFKARLRFEPLHMIVDGIAWWRARCERLKIVFGQLESTLNARIDVVTLLKVDVLEEIAANGSRGNGIAVHLNSLDVRNRSFDRHQALAEIFVDAWRGVRFGHTQF